MKQFITNYYEGAWYQEIYQHPNNSPNNRIGLLNLQTNNVVNLVTFYTEYGDGIFKLDKDIDYRVIGVLK